MSNIIKISSEEGRKDKLHWMHWSDVTGHTHSGWNNSFNHITENASLSGEPGLLISQVNEKNPFFGYAGNKKQTEKKLLCDVFRKGDVYFNTGDLMVQDQENFLYFWDRIGDTFRYGIALVAKLVFRL